MTQVDLACEDGNIATIISLLFDRRKAGAVLWGCCEHLATGHDVSKADFLESLEADALNEGVWALVDAVIFFSPKQLQETLRAGAAKIVETLELGSQRYVEAILQNPDLDATIKAQVEKIGENLTTGLSEAFANSAGG